ncbi:keratin-associated protein 9-4-like [Leguminivora glycinivorella]|uniref:keratin-associated protein 9-4-like n=1 Tax=Leguminivora glycinivorella TaxID=1035111 RepID=UPI00200EA10D|nr:keratin-associated protein 9-4-like [Leguminivora glycinivorella]
MWLLILSSLVLVDGLYACGNLNCSAFCTENYINIDTSKTCSAKCSGPALCEGKCTSKDDDIRPCEIECVGAKCAATCTGARCKAMCSGNHCTAECKGEGCSSICYTSSCTVLCEGADCTSTADIKIIDITSSIDTNVKCTGDNCTSTCNGEKCIVSCFGKACDAYCFDKDNKDRSEGCVALQIYNHDVGAVNINV